MLNLNNLSVILVEPQMGENIGAVARVMSNFGAHHLRLVSPRDGWPNSKAIEMSAHGSFVLEKADVYESLENAISDLHYVVATTANSRDICKPHFPIKQIQDHVQNRCTDPQKIGLVFGRERSGLTNEEISFADAIVSINTHHLNPSLNLAQAVGIVLYELSNQSDCNLPQINYLSASSEEINHMIAQLEQHLDKAGFFRIAEKKNGMMINIRNTIKRMHLTAQDVRTLRGIMKSVMTNR